jgi:polar amino acid transport system permease protein
MGAPWFRSRWRRRWLLRRAALLALLVVAAAVVAQVVANVARNPLIHYGAFGQYQFSRAILSGVVVTLELTILSMLIGLLLGVLLALARLSRDPLLRTAAGAYVWFFRGTPVLIQLIFWFNLSLIFKTLAVGIPFGPVFASVPTNSVISGFSAALLGLGLNEGAYMAEIVRSGILAVDRGQGEAARALGMTPSQVMRIVILPQALRVVVPPTSNQCINMLKVTSLVSVIGGGDLLTNAENISSQNFLVVELLAVAALWYLALTTLATFGQQALERRLARGQSLGPREAHPGPVTVAEPGVS